MENLNAVFINEGMPQSERLHKLNQIAIQQMTVLENVGAKWNVGNAINTFVLQGKRAEYGKQIVATVSRQLVAKERRGIKSIIYGMKV